MNESDPRSNVHYLGSSENKACKKFRLIRDCLSTFSIRATKHDRKGINSRTHNRII